MSGLTRCDNCSTEKPTDDESWFRLSWTKPEERGKTDKNWSPMYIRGTGRDLCSPTCVTEFIAKRRAEGDPAFGLSMLVSADDIKVDLKAGEHVIKADVIKADVHRHALATAASSRLLMDWAQDAADVTTSAITEVLTELGHDPADPAVRASVSTALGRLANPTT